MRARNFFPFSALALALMPLFAQSAETTVDGHVDTFGKLLAKQVELIDSELDAKIRAVQAQGKPQNSTAQGPVIASPLPEAKQEISDQEPIVEAIWGMAGKEVAEVVYKGRRVAISMQEPYISRLDGWKLERISNFEIVLIKTDHNRVSQRRAITLNWGLGNSSKASDMPALPSSNFMPASIGR
ncbi:hypothetical protein [Delftia sp. PS-11]|uniref:hypothetical protein n=1 Tax=Delftia sp. PS-11 TaxID=2767222 RepID=UPI002458011E|nr:hypothetical protein [Delftia sp. PS-11]KAJ8744158.1 hypothetical protein H9T68_14175 [Delftia sp. PS-11]